MPPFDAAPGNRDDTDRVRHLLDVLAEGTAAQTGAGFFPRLVEGLATALGVARTLIVEVAEEGHVRGLGEWPSGKAQRDWEIASTCFASLQPGEIRLLTEATDGPFEPAVSYGARHALVMALAADAGGHLGFLAAFDAEPMRFDDEVGAIARIFAARAKAELERRRLERTLGESEERLRDLFDEAPIAYVHEGLDSRFLRANRTAMRTLGITPEEVPGTFGMSFIPDTPDAQRRVKAAFDSIGRGTDTGGVVLELRRKDNGKPLWIQWWSRPDPSGSYTRTMFLDITEQVLLEREQALLQAQNRYLQEEIKLAHNFEEIVGESPALLRVLEDVKRVAPTDASVLITGETGTGKELIARAIHSNSRRRDKPLIKLNCAALPTNLVESELFGHEKGAFTGALAQRIGRFELAHTGTIFLDEIGEVPLDVQVKLLRVLQEHEIERVGGNTPLKCDVRIIAATNRDLAKEIGTGRFRQDLFYRLNVFPLHLPPLRERAGDIERLVKFFLEKFSARIGKRVDSIHPETLARFRAYPWPGNVRELENFVERAVILAPSTVLETSPEPMPSVLGLASSSARPSTPPTVPPAVPQGLGAMPASLASVGREHIVATLVRSNWVIEGPAGAAQVLGLHPNTLRSRMKKLGIVRP